MDSVGPFEIVERLGAGVLGELFRAHDTRRDRLVALRVVHPRLVTDQLTHEALLADARAGAAFSHPHAAGLLEIVEEGEQLALVHELAGGRALSALIENGPLDPPLAIRIAEQVAGALGAAAGQGLLHRALEPSSILVDGGEAMLLDLGLSRWTGSGAARRAAVTALDANPASSNRDAARSARYVSPEQALGAPGDGRADVFSLGVILFEMLTGTVNGKTTMIGRTVAAGWPRHGAPPRNHTVAAATRASRSTTPAAATSRRARRLGRLER